MAKRLFYLSLIVQMWKVMKSSQGRLGENKKKIICQQKNKCDEEVSLL